MNNKGTKKEPLVQRREFYIALYGCLGALLVLAAVISYNNYTAVTRAKELSAQRISAEELQEASASTVQSYLTPEDRGQADTTPPTLTRPQTSTRPTPAPEAKPNPESKPAVTTNEPAQSSAPQTGTPKASPEPAKTTPAAAKPTAESSLAPPVFEEYAEGTKMTWPVLGEIVMEYSKDSLVYDKTLEQYRTNEALCIATDVGTPVYAATSGIVKSVTKSNENGNSVELDHGNGWVTTYSQLQDGVLVKTGDVVSEGQVIGGVGYPSIYGALLGNHLAFSVAQNSETVDPQSILE